MVVILFGKFSPSKKWAQGPSWRHSVNHADCIHPYAGTFTGENLQNIQRKIFHCIHGSFNTLFIKHVVSCCRTSKSTCGTLHVISSTVLITQQKISELHMYQWSLSFWWLELWCPSLQVCQLIFHFQCIGCSMCEIDFPFCQLFLLFSFSEM